MYLSVISKRSIKENVIFQSPDPIIKDERLSFLNWEEHCVECSPPYCYGNCENYLCRTDRKCIRLRYGIERIKEINGPLGYGVKCVFRKWAKIETKWNGKSLTLINNKRQDRFWNFLGVLCLSISKMLRFMSPKLRIYGAYILIRNIYFKKQKANYIIPNLFYIDCYLINKESVSLMIQIDSTDKIYMTRIVKLVKGENEIKVDLNFQIPLGARLFVTPLEETDTTIYFKWLDVFQGYLVEKEEHASKVKVVAWDLDNTLWKGVLINGEGVVLNDNVIKVIKELDKRGILNTIVSKNDKDDAIRELKRLGIYDYFLCPEINWNPKSDNIRQIAKNLNLGINSFAFIDDNVREREEVRRSLPAVRIYSDSDIETLIEQDPFDVPVTEISQKRRALYIEDSKRVELESSFGNNYNEFLKSLRMSLFPEPISKDNKERCFELLSRSNQLNLSTNRYSVAEYDKLLKNEDYICRAFRVKDTFGDYGIIAFLSLKISGDTGFITDFVISCRIAKKKVEQAIFASLKVILELHGIVKIVADLKITKKNSPLVDVFTQLPFEIEEEDKAHILYVMKDISKLKEIGIIDIMDSNENNYRLFS